MALFKILNNFNSGNQITNIANNSLNHVQGYCYFDKNTNKFYIDTTDNASGFRQLNGSYYGICGNTGDVLVKTVAIPGFALVEGVCVYIKFAYENTSPLSTLQLNVSNTGAKNIKYYGITNLNKSGDIKAGSICQFVYDGTNWLWVGHLDSNTEYVFADDYNATSNPGATVQTVLNAIENVQYAVTSSFASTADYAASASFASSANYAGTANTALKLNTDAGNFLNPVYFSNGIPVASKGNSIPFIIGTGTTAGTWIGTLEGLTGYYDGLLILYKSPVAGASTTTLNLNSLGAKTVYINNTTKLTTHFPANQPILLVYSTSQNSGCWMALDDYWTDSNTIPSGYCTTAASTAAKTASCTYWVATPNSYLHFDIRYTNTKASAITMNVNSTGAKPIYINGQPSSATNYDLKAGSYIAFYDGTNFQFRTDGYLPGFGIIGKASSADYATTAGYAEEAAHSALADNATTADWAATADWATTAGNATDSTKVAKAGDTMTGALILSGAPISDNQAATKKYVDDSLSSIAGPMRFMGTLGSGTTATTSTLPSASNSNKGHSYKVITDGTYQNVDAKIGDLMVSDGSQWINIPSGDEPKGTVINVATGDGLTGGPITISGTISHATPNGASSGSKGGSGRTYIQTITTDDFGHVTAVTTASESVTNTHYTTHLYAGNQTAATSHATTGTNGNVYLRLYDDTTAREAIKIEGTGATTVTDGGGTITINSTNTTYNAATSATAGLMSAADKAKLDGIATAANAYSLPTASTTIKGGIKVGTGLTMSGETLNHSNSVTAKTAFVDTATTASANGGTIKVTDVKYDAQGHITGTQDRTITLSQTTYTLSGLGGVGTVTASGTAPLTLSASKSGTTVTVIGSVVAATTTSAGVLAMSNANINTMLNQLTTGSSDPQDNDYYISQYVGGGTTTTTYHRRPMSNLYNYIKTKLNITNSAPTLSWGNTSTIGSVGGVNLQVKMPANPNSNTTYTFASGMDGFTVTPSGGSAQTVSVTSSYSTTAGKAGALSNTAKIGDTNKPVYFSATGTPVAINYTIDKSVPSNAIFTDQNVTQTNITSDASEYRLLLSGSANDTTETTTTKKNTNLRFNPSTNILSIGGSISATGDLDLTGNATISGETYVDSLTAGSLLVNGAASFVQIPTAPTPAANSNDTQLATTAFVMNAFTSNDAMVFKGVINANSALPAAHSQGWTYRIGTAGTYAGKVCEVGDIIICVTDGTAANNDHWAVIQNNIDGAVYKGTNAFTDNNIIVADSTAGKVKSSGVTISTSAPASSSGDTTVPTSKAVWSAITGASGYGKTGTVTTVTAGAGLTTTAGGTTDGGSITTAGTLNLTKVNSNTGSYGPSAAVTGSNGTTMNVPYITVDAYGRVTAISNKVYTAQNTTYNNATSATAGLMSATDKAKLDGIATSANNYSLPLATTSIRGGVKIGYTQSGKNYPVQLSNEQMYVNVPWENTTYTFTAGTSTLAWNSEVTLATVGGLAVKAKLPTNPDTDTKNTVGASQSTSKLFLVGPMSQATSAQSFSHTAVYAQDGAFAATSVKIAEKVTLQYNNTTNALDFVFA